MISAHARHALRTSLGVQPGNEVIKLLDRLDDELKAESAHAKSKADKVKPVLEPSAPEVAGPAPVAPAVAVTEDESSHLDAPSA